MPMSLPKKNVKIQIIKIIKT